MARKNFAACMAEIFAHEGGYVDHPKDPGGATNMGIMIGTLRDWRGGPVTKEDVRSLTKREAETIYRARYWNWVRGDDLRTGVDLVALDPAVNSGVRRGVQWLQRAVGVAADGKMGPLTLKAANDAMPVEAVAIRMAVEASTVPARPTLIAEQAEAENKARRDGTNTDGVAVGGSAGTTLADLPEWTILVLFAVVVLAVINLLGRRRHEQERAAAFQAVAEDARA
jgi:lysozyme family protein